MKKIIIAVVLLLALPLLAATDKVVTIWTGQATNASTTVDATGYQTAQVTIWAVSGSPDGTVKVYAAGENGAPSTLLATYATPTTVKRFRGPAGTGLIVALSGMSTGTVGAVVVLK